MELQPKLIGLVADELEASRSVPMPGGHGTILDEARGRVAAYRDAPGVPERCVVVLGVLGDKGPLGKADWEWVLRDWVSRARDWFILRRHAVLKTIAVPEQARYLVAGMLVLVQRAPRLSSLASMPAVVADITAMLTLGRLANRRTGLAPMPGIALRDAKEAIADWRKLAGSIPQQAWALLFLRRLHARLDVFQPRPDDQTLDPGAREFYKRLVDLLRAVRCLGSALPLARAIATAIEQCALVRGTNAPSTELRRLMETLPADFQLHRQVEPAVAPSKWLPQSTFGLPPEADLAIWLAEAIADTLYDPLRVRPHDAVPGFTAQHYAWLLPRCSPNSRRYFDLLSQGRLPELVQRYLSSVLRSHWADFVGPDKPCALCHLETQATNVGAV